MGTIIKRTTIEGRTLTEAFENLQEEDRHEKGGDFYSGGWNNSSGVTVVSAKEFDKRRENEDVDKWSPAIAKLLIKPVENKNSIKSAVKNFPNKGTRKWETVYIGYYGEGRSLTPMDSQSAAIQKAREFVSENPSAGTVYIHIEKRLTKNNTKVAEVNYKKSSTEKDGKWEILGAMSY